MKQLLGILALAIAAPLAAQDTLSPIVVTATRTPEPASTLGNSVTVLDGAALRRAGMTTVLDALRGVASLSFAQTGSTGAQTSMFLRGGESDYVRVLRDGVPLNQAGGAIDLSTLSLDNVERIEIVRGPASVLYGSDAMTGVIQLITRRGGKGSVGLDALGGGRETGQGNLEVTLGEGVGLTFGAQRATTRGIYDINNRFRGGAATASLWLHPGRSDLRITASHQESEYHYPTDGYGAPVDSNAFGRSRRTVLSIDAGRRLTNRLEVRALLGFVQGRDSTQDDPDSPGDTLNGWSESRRGVIRRSADLRVNLQAGPATLLTLGSAVELQRERDRSSFTYPGFGTSPSSTEGSRTNRAGYAQVVTGRGPVSLQAGARVDDNQRFGTFGTWRLGASVRAGATTRLRANAGTAFKEPTFDENFNTAFSTGNPDLKPERSMSIEAGIDQQIGSRVTLGVTAFAQRFRDMIQYAYGNGGPDYHNIGSADADGIESQVSLTPVDGLRLAAQYTYLHTESHDSTFLGPAGLPLLRRPKHNASLSGEWLARAWSLGGRVTYMGWRDDIAPSGRAGARPYTRTDLWGSAHVAGTQALSLALTARINNVMGLAYEEVRGFRAPGRELLVGLRLAAR